ncbi:MAG TPA: fatty acid desaturase [Allosphingosinicella sp.]
MSRARQIAIGLLLAAAIIASWLTAHIVAVFFVELSGRGLLVAPALVLLQCWLSVGLFIVAHDCMHGALAPGRPALNRSIGRLALLLYAGFSFDRLSPKHFDHHRHAGTGADPDFDEDHPDRFWPWYRRFIRQYLGLRELCVIAAGVAVYLLLLGASLANLLLFWAVPAILSSLQLFLFGTYLPHRAGPDPFADRHRARSSSYGNALSLLTCFHFGYHHEHHRSPATPWWRLPAERTGSARAG